MLGFTNPWTVLCTAMLTWFTCPPLATVRKTTEELLEDLIVEVQILQLVGLLSMLCFCAYVFFSTRDVRGRDEHDGWDGDLGQPGVHGIDADNEVGHMEPGVHGIDADNEVGHMHQGYEPMADVLAHLARRIEE
jgi:hypothetical protein